VILFYENRLFIIAKLSFQLRNGEFKLVKYEKTEVIVHLFSVLLIQAYASVCILLSVLLYLILQQTITSILTILIFCYHSQLWISLITLLTLKKPQLTYPTGCLTISCLLILLKLSFSSLVYHNNSLNYQSSTLQCHTLTF